METEKSTNLETSDRQLFFSTDGSEPEEDPESEPPKDDPVVVEKVHWQNDEKAK